MKQLVMFWKLKYIGLDKYISFLSATITYRTTKRVNNKTDPMYSL